MKLGKASICAKIQLQGWSDVELETKGDVAILLLSPTKTTGLWDCQRWCVFHRQKFNKGKAVTNIQTSLIIILHDVTMRLAEYVTEFRRDVTGNGSDKKRSVQKINKIDQ